MGRIGALANTKLIPSGQVAPGLSGMTSGTALGLLCLACVAWTIVRDRSLRSELALEGASHVIQPATSPAASTKVKRRAALTLDTGADVESSPVVNAYLELSPTFASPVSAETTRLDDRTMGSRADRPADLPAATGGIHDASHIEARPGSRLTAMPTD